MRPLTILVLAVAIAIAPRAFADKKADVQKHLTTAYAAYKDGRWQDVLDALHKAYKIDPKPELHYSMGQVYIKMGRCPDAIRAYGKYLASKPTTSNAGVAREAIASCKASATADPTPDPEPEPEPQPEPQPAPQSRPSSPKAPPPGAHWNKLGVGMTAGGAAMLVASGTFYLLARRDLGDARDAGTYREQVDRFDNASTKRSVSVGLAIGGVAMVTIGLVRGVRTKPRERLALVPTREGGLVTWMTRF